MSKHNDIKKNIDKAVALGYKSIDVAPKVIAKGEGLIANKIVQKAMNEDIVVYKDENLVESLMGLEINQEIPEELYEAVAEIILYIYNLDIKRGNQND